MTKRQLARYVRMGRELRAIDMQIIDPRIVTDRVQASGVLYPYLPYHASVTGVDPKTLLRLRRRRAQIKRRMDDIENFVDKLADGYMREIIRARYIDGRTWVQIGVAVNTTSDCIKKAASRYLEKVCSP